MSKIAKSYWAGKQTFKNNGLKREFYVLLFFCLFLFIFLSFTSILRFKSKELRHWLLSILQCINCFFV